ncbi:hypothetical protein AB0G74_27685 [Streptomyces sp. NPDC020875]|uniref:hypothetical protein n=1 Tax=Streptomyces sp. NPDC020875 TaxID=3154898 RepID=UPI0033E02D68
MNTLLKPSITTRPGNCSGPVETWTSTDFEVFENLTAIARAASPYRGPVRRRAAAVTVFGYATGLYAVALLVRAVRGQRAPRLEGHLDAVVAGPLADAERRLRAAGDGLFRLRVEQTGRRVIGAIDRTAARLARD